MNSLFKLFMDIFVLSEKISVSENESSALSVTLTFCFFAKGCTFVCNPHPDLKYRWRGVIPKNKLRKHRAVEEILIGTVTVWQQTVLKQTFSVGHYPHVHRNIETILLAGKKHRRKFKVLASFIKKGKCKALIRCTLFSVIPRKTPVIPRKTPRIPRIMP